jgi:hypothetical protein
VKVQVLSSAFLNFDNCMSLLAHAVFQLINPQLQAGELVELDYFLCFLTWRSLSYCVILSLKIIVSGGNYCDRSYLTFFLESKLQAVAGFDHLV